MARQNGFLHLEGTLGDVTFVRTKGGFKIRQKGGVPGSRIANDPNFVRTRENGAEFGNSGKTGKRLREAFGSEVELVSDARLTSRMLKMMMQIMKTDTTHRRGERQPASGDLTLLKGFEFNGAAQLSTNLLVQPVPTIDRATGALSIDLPAFTPQNTVIAPPAATHFRIRSAGGAVDLLTGDYNVKSAATAELPIDENETDAVQLSMQIGAGATQPIFLLLGMEFIQELNGIFYPLRNGSFNSLAIVLVDVEV